MRAAIVASVPSQVQPRAAQRFAPGRWRCIAVGSTHGEQCRHRLLRARERLVAGPPRGHGVVRRGPCSADAGRPPARGRRREPDRHVRAQPVEATAAHADPDLHAHVRDEGRGACRRRQDQRGPHPHQRHRPRHRASATTRSIPSCCSTSTRASSTPPCCSSSSRSAGSTTRDGSGSTRSRCSRRSSASSLAR